MQEAGFQAINKKAVYAVFELSLPAFKRTIKKISPEILRGFNVTVPYKQTMLSYVNELTEEARFVGAVNTVFRKRNRWVGANTDVFGFMQSLKKEAGFSPGNKKNLVLGAGGAARAVVYGLSKEGAQAIFIANRTLSKAQIIAKEFSRKFSRVDFQAIEISSKSIPPFIAQADLVVNTTSLGLHETDSSPLAETLIPKASLQRKLFVDLIYHRNKTTFLANAERQGHKTLNGLGMLLWQGVKAFELWTGKAAPVKVMQKALIEQLKQNVLNQKGNKK